MNNVVEGSSMGQAALDKIGVGILSNVVARVAPSMGKMQFVVVGNQRINVQYNGMLMGSIFGGVGRYMKGEWLDLVQIKHSSVRTSTSSMSTSNETKAVREIVKRFVVPEDALELRRAREHGVGHAQTRNKVLMTQAKEALSEYVTAHLSGSCDSLGPLFDALSVPMHERKPLEEAANSSVEWATCAVLLGSATAVAAIGDKYVVAVSDELQYVDEIPESLRTQVAMLKLAGDKVFVPNMGMQFMRGTLPVYLCLTNQPV
jgi:hypothetical protein